MKSKRANELIISCTRKEVFARRARVSLKEKQSSQDNLWVYTSGNYTITRKTSNPSRQGKNFVLNCDLFRCHRLRVASYKEFEELSKTDEKVKWLVNNTNISKDLFRIAKQHRDLPLPFCIDFVKYEKHLKENAENGEIRKNFLWEVSD